jgi:peptidoglycan/LPS O-acetylase OafA/YrhL
MNRRADIQGFRALAVGLVVLAHAGVPLLAGGYVGVDMFFVLSGYLITSLLVQEASETNAVSISGFYARRAKRILPAATLTLVVTSAASLALLNFVRAKQVMIDAFSAGLFVSNFRFASHGTDYFAQGQPPSPVQQFWSLSVEEQFYVFWPVVLAALVGAAIVGGRLAMSPELDWRRLQRGSALLVVASLAYSVYETASNPAVAYFSTGTRAWELGLGALFAVVTTARPYSAVWSSRFSVTGLRVAGWVGFVMVVVSAVLFSADTAFPGYAALLPTVGAVLMIAAGEREEALGEWSVGRLFSLKPLGYVGDRSYSMYLWHWPVLILAAEWAGHDLSVWVNLGLVVVAFLISVLSFRFVEDPLRRRSWTPASRALLLWPASLAAVVVVTAAGLNIVNRQERSTLVDAAVAASRDDLKAVQGDAAGAGVDVVDSSSGAKASSGQGLQVAPAAVKAAALLAQKPGSKFPSVLDPVVGSLAKDYYGERCDAAPTESSSKICPYGDLAGTRRIAVLGDSQAQMWLPALLEVARAKKWTILPIIKNGCTPVAWMDGTGTIGEACKKWLPWAIKTAYSQRADAVILSGHYGDKVKDGRQLPSMLNGYSAGLKGLRKIKSVILMNDIPDRSKEPTDCLLASGASPSSCADTPVQGYWSFGSTLRSLAAGTHATFIDPSPWVCFQGSCPLVVGNKITYYDRAHISATYSKWLAPYLASSVTKVLSGTSPAGAVGSAPRGQLATPSG